MAHSIKLQRRDTTRIRVRDLACEVGVPPATVLGFIRELGEFVASPASCVEAPIAGRVRQQFGSAIPAKVANPARDTAMDEVAGSTEVDQHAKVHLDAPRQLPRRENHPMMGVRTVVAISASSDAPLDPVAERVWDEPITFRTCSVPSEGDLDYSAAGAFRPSETFRYLEWSVRGMNEAEREVWLAHGLGSTHARIAADCNGAGIRPQDLGVLVSGYTILDRITHGESPAHVARLWNTQRQRDAG